MGAFVGGLLLGSFVAGEKGMPSWLNSRWELAAAGAGVGMMLGGLAAWRDFAHLQRLRDLAGQLGFQFLPSAPEDVVARVQMLMGSAGFVRVRNCLLRQDQENALLVGEVAIREGSGENSRYVRQTVAWIRDAKLELPQFTLRPEGLMVNLVANMLGQEDIDFDSHPQFSKAYHLSGPEQETRELFQTPLLDLFTAQPGWDVRGEHNDLMLMWPRRTVPNQRLPEFIQQVREIHARFVAASANRPPISGDKPAAAAKSGRRTQETAPGDAPKGLRGAMARASQRTNEELEAFLSSPPPRQVPWKIRARLGGGLCFAFFFSGVLGCIGGMLAFIGGTMPADQRAFPIGLGVALVLLAGGIFSMAWLLRGRKLRVLSHGRLATGLIEKVEATNVQVNGQQRFRAYVAYEADGLRQQTRVHLYGGHAVQARRASEQQTPMALLYSQSDPQRIVLALQLTPNVPERW